MQNHICQLILSPRAIARRSARAATVAEALKRLVGYDNERGKGDHRYIGDRRERYVFKTVELLIADFLANVRGLRGERRYYFNRLDCPHRRMSLADEISTCEFRIRLFSQARHMR
jgi:hypothetical protein